MSYRESELEVRVSNNGIASNSVVNFSKSFQAPVASDAEGHAFPDSGMQA
jgi:hypothetical protein